MEALDPFGDALDETGIHAGFVNGGGLYMTGTLGGTDPRAT